MTVIYYATRKKSVILLFQNFENILQYFSCHYACAFCFNENISWYFESSKKENGSGSFRFKVSASQYFAFVSIKTFFLDPLNNISGKTDHVVKNIFFFSFIQQCVTYDRGEGFEFLCIFFYFFVLEWKEFLPFTQYVNRNKVRIIYVTCV